MLLFAAQAGAETPAAAPAASDAAPNEGVLGEFLVTGITQERLPKIAVLPSLSPELEDVIVRGVVRRDFELTGLFDVLPDSKAPAGLYGFEDPVDVEAWQKVGAEAIVKVSAQKKDANKIQVLGIAYFLNVGKEPVYQKTIIVNKADARVTAHRITDALLGALTGRPGSFASELTFSGKWVTNRRIFRMDADGNGLVALTDPGDTAIAPSFGAPGHIFYALSHNYSPFSLMDYAQGASKSHQFAVQDRRFTAWLSTRIAPKLGARSQRREPQRYLRGQPGRQRHEEGVDERACDAARRGARRESSLWVGGDPKQGSQRIYVDDKAVSPAGFTAASPTFCDTEDGVKLVYSVAVGGNRQDLVIAAEKGQNMARLTQNQGSNSYPACSPDGRLVAFFSNRNKAPGIWLMSLKSWKAQQVSTQEGESLAWAALPPVTGGP